jgi:hypothetical protein
VLPVGASQWRAWRECTQSGVGNGAVSLNGAGWLRVPAAAISFPVAWSTPSCRSLGDRKHLHPEIIPHPKVEHLGTISRSIVGCFPFFTLI